MSESKQIIVSVTNDLVTDQRVHKVCSSLALAGYNVKVVGRKFKNSQPLKREYETDRMRLLFNKSAFFYAEYNIRLFFYLLFSKADVLLSNDTDTLLANFLVAKIKQKQLIFDAHEMFPEIPEVVDRKFVKLFWTKIEDLIFPKLKYCYTVCQSIADIYNKKYGIQMQVVRNIPFANPSVKSTKLLDKKGKQILLYQGAVNVGRGIEWIIDAMPFLDNCIFYIIGDGDIVKEIQQKIRLKQLEDRVLLLGRVPFEELAAYTSNADIGMSLLENKGLNYYYSLPNRIFDFIRANVPVLATDFPEIRNVVENYGVGTLTNNYDPQYLASVINKMLNVKIDSQNFDKANADLTWENESKVIIRIVKEAVYL